MAIGILIVFSLCHSMATTMERKTRIKIKICYFLWKWNGMENEENLQITLLWNENGTMNDIICYSDDCRR